MSGYVGRGINYGNAATDHFTGNGGATYTLNYDTTTDGVIVSLDGVVQKNGTDFNVTSGTSLVFTSVVASPIAIQVVYTGLTLSLGTPADATVSKSKITTTLINEHVDTTITASDSILFADATDSNANKKDTVQGILDLVPAHTGNVAFPATQVASADANTLDDYEEASFTPVLQDNSGNQATHTAQVGYYTKIGRHVFFNCYVAISSLGSMATLCLIGGLPFACSSDTSSNFPVASAQGAGLAITAGHYLSGYVESNASYIRLQMWDSTAGTSHMPPSEWSADGSCYFSGHYRV